MLLTKIVMSAHSSFIFLNASSHTDLCSTPSTHILWNMDKWTSGAKKRNTEIDFMSSRVDGISMDRKGAFKARMWFSIVIQESCKIYEGIVSNRIKKKEKYWRKMNRIRARHKKEKIKNHSEGQVSFGPTNLAKTWMRERLLLHYLNHFLDVNIRKKKCITHPLRRSKDI